MPFKPFKEKKEWCVYKVDEDGNRVKKIGCGHKTKDDAIAQIGAIESEMRRSGKKSESPITDVEPEIMPVDKVESSDGVREEDVQEINSLYAIKSLGGNRIEDLTPLVENPAIGYGDQIYLAGEIPGMSFDANWKRANPLSQKTIRQDIPKLRDRGVQVVF